MTEFDPGFEIATSRIRFGPGTTREVGMDLADLGVKKTLLVIDPKLCDLPPGLAVLESLRQEKIDFDVFDGVRCEPSQESFLAAIQAASGGGYDAFVALGGGSTIDTAKVANLYSTHPADILDYVNAPLGKGIPIPGPLKPLIAIPTTAGTGSETTGVAICDLKQQKLKTGIAHRFLKPTLGILDPDNTRSMPAEVAAATGLDVLCHALESYTAVAFDSRPRPARPSLRPNYQGANPISDVWCQRALAMTAEYLPRAVADTSDDEARGQMMLAATYAGIGFGNSGVHLCHAMSYPISSLVGEYTPPGYDADHPLVPHGVSVTLTAPAVFRFTASACPQRHLRGAELLGADVNGASLSEAGEILAQRLIKLIRELKLPNGLAAVGFGSDDIAELTAGALQQERLTKLSPRGASGEDLAAMFQASLTLW